MTLNTVTLKWSVPDLIQSGLSGTLTITPSAQMSDATDHELIPVFPRSVSFSGGAGQLAGIVGNDDTQILPAGTGYIISVVASNGQVIVAPFTTQILYADGATQYLDELAEVPVVTTSYQYLPLPSGTAAEGDVPVATGSGNESAWGSGGGSGAVSSVFARTGAVVAVSGDYTVSEVTGAAPLASPALTGTPTAPTATALTGSTRVATTAYTDSAVAVETGRAETAEALLAPYSWAASWTALATETSRAEAAEALALLLAGGTMSGAIAMGSHKITGLTNGGSAQDAAAFGQIPVADATAAHILADGAQTAGAHGEWADSGHIHPAMLWVPSDNELLTAQGGDPSALTSTNILIAGTLYLVKLPIRTAMTISNLVVVVSTAGGGTSTTSFAGLYSPSGTLLTGSSDVGTPLKSGGPATLPLTTPQALAAGSFVWGALLVNLGTTQPTLLKGGSITNGSANIGLAATAYRWAVNGTLLSALPSPSITPASNTATGALTVWCGAT